MDALFLRLLRDLLMFMFFLLGNHIL